MDFCCRGMEGQVVYSSEQKDKRCFSAGDFILVNETCVFVFMAEQSFLKILNSLN